MVLNITESNFEKLTYRDLSDPASRDRAFCKRLKDGISWYQSKYQIVKNAIKTYLKSPTIKLDFA